MIVRDTIERDMTNEPQSVVKVYETAVLRTDLMEYVLTDQLARSFTRVLEGVVESARPSGKETGEVGIWISGFFGSGKSHFAKLAGHLLADTPVGADSARGLFRRLLHSGRPSDERLQELLQEANTYRLDCHLVAFDITAQHSPAADRNVGLTFLRAFYEFLGVSKYIPFAEREIELQSQRLYEKFQELYQNKTGTSWVEDKDMTTSSPCFAECLSELSPTRYPTVELAHQSLNLADREVDNITIDGVADRFTRWLEAQQKEDAKRTQRLVFVADEVGAWAGRDLRRIEQLRSLIETLAVKGRGRVWLMVTSQERLSAVVSNADTSDPKTAQDLLQRLEARFRINIHLESSEVGTVIEDRILRKKPTARPSLEKMWAQRQQAIADFGQSPGLELGADYPKGERELSVKSYPFLPYQLPAAADIFGGMRGVKVSAGARSMIKVAFDATRELANRDIGAIVSWDQIFDSANRDNEFADESYLGSQGLTYIASADHDIPDAAVRPSGILKVLWLVQQNPRIPRTIKNLARLMVNRLDADVLQLERDVEETLEALAQHSFVRQEVGTEQWRFLTQDEVTVEKIAQRIAEELRAPDVRKEVFELYQQQVKSLFPGRITVGKSNAAFDYGIYVNDTVVINERAPVQLRVALEDTAAAQRSADESAANLDTPAVSWVVPVPSRLHERLRRAMAIKKLPEDEEFKRVATERTKREARNLEDEEATLRQAIQEDLVTVLHGGTLYWGGNTVEINGNGGHRSGRGLNHGVTAKTKVEDALRDRIGNAYPRFVEGDYQFNPANIDKVLTAPAGDRVRLDTNLKLFSPDGHVFGNHVVVEELTNFLKKSTKTSGQDVTAHFSDQHFGWPPDLLRYVAAAMFVDGKLSVVDKAGKRYDDPRVSAARGLFGTAAFRTTRLEVEEEALTPQESTDTRTLLTELGHPPQDGSEVALREAALRLCESIARRLAVIEKAREAGLPLPTNHDAMSTTLEAVWEPGSRVKTIRALLGNSDRLREASAALQRLEEFDRHNCFRQYQRSQILLETVLQAGLAEDVKWGEQVQQASDEIEALKEQRRVLEEWDGAFSRYRIDVMEAFRTTYAPLRNELHERVAQERAAITSMPEYQALSLSNSTLMRTEFLSDGRPLAEVSLPDLQDEEQMLAANAEYSIPHLRSALAALDAVAGEARARVLELCGKEQRQRGEKERVAVWKPSEAFVGKRFTTEEEVDEVFDSEKERVKALIRQGKTVQVI